jgi:hypothetical protein
MQRTMLSVALCLSLAAVSPVLAGPSVQVEAGLYQAGSGGEFKTTILTGDVPGIPLGSSFQTFCVEMDEYISLPGTYYSVVNTSAVQGGVGGPEPDPLDPRTAWLYHEFANGDLAGYDYSTTAGRRTSAEALQNAIWYLEQEIPSLPGGLATNFYNQATLCGWTDLGDVRVLNLYGDEGHNQQAQDVLCQVSVVPVPGALLLVGIGTAAFGAFRRRLA